MSSRGAFSGQGRGGGGPGARGGGGSGLAGGHGPRSQFEQQFNGMSIKDKVAVDGTSLQMGKAVPPPRPDPMPSNEVDAEVFKDILEGLEALDAQAEFPLRQTFAKPDTSVYTNHFAIKLDQNMPLYEYNITGLPAKTNKRTARMLVQAAIDNLPVFETNQNKFATDYDRKLVAWVELPRQASIRTRKLCYTYVRATLGVSYCPPAYYADLLCERGRCYLRDYLAPTPNTVSATKHRQFKDELVIEAKQARKCKNFKQDVRTYRSKMMNVQSAAERRQELEDEKRVENKLKAKTFEMAREKFYAGSAERNPWNPKSGGTTFWM